MTALKRAYRRQRDHQASVVTEGGGTETRYPSGRVEYSYASAPYGEHALCAFVAAKRDLAFAKRRK